VAKHLYDQGLISSAADFLKRLADLRLTGELLDGSYQLRAGMELDALISSITVHK
jgi:hypothetical protein